jgi:protein-arginine kinase activator protein McsA
MITLPTKSPDVWKRFFAENRSLVNSYVARQIKRGIKEQLHKVELVSFSDGTEPSCILQERYLPTLQYILQYFIKNEEYEQASIVNTIINEYYIDTLIQETIPGD